MQCIYLSQICGPREAVVMQEHSSSFAEHIPRTEAPVSEGSTTSEDVTPRGRSVGAKVHHYLSLRPMAARNPHEPGRTATSLELFFDLVFVVAAGNSAEHFHEALIEGIDRHSAAAVYKFLMVSFAVW